MTTGIIRKHKNRKLYDASSHSCVSLGELWKMYRNHKDFKVIDSNDDDITEETLFKSIMSTGLKNKSFRKRVIEYASKDAQ